MATTAYTRAKQAQKELQIKRQELARKEIESIEARIEKQISQGKFELEISELSPEARLILTDHGYGIDSRQTGMNEYTIYIYWHPKIHDDELSNNKR